METSVKEVGRLKKELLVKIPGDEVRARHEKIIDTMASRLNIKGFRKGRVPQDLARRYVKISAEEQLLMDLLYETMEDALKEAGIGTSDFRQIGFYIKPILEQGSFEYRIRVQLYPEVDPEKYLGIAVSIEEPAEITPEDVEKRIEELRKDALQPQEKDSVVAINDLVNLTYSRYEEGNPEPTLKNFSTAVRVEDDKDLLIKGLKDALIGLKKEETFDVTGPGTVGKDMKTYRLTGKVDRVSTLVMPKVNDDLARQFGAEDVDDLKKKILQTLKEGRDTGRKELIEKEILKKLLDFVPLDDDQALMKEILSEMDSEDILDEEYLEDPKNIAKTAKAIKTEVVLKAIAVKENIEVSEEDINQELMGIAKASGRSLPYIKAQIHSQMENGTLDQKVQEKKVLDLLVRYAKVNKDGGKKTEPEAEKNTEEAGPDEAETGAMDKDGDQ